MKLTDCPQCMNTIFHLGTPVQVIEALATTAQARGITTDQLVAQIHAEHGGK